MRVTETGGTRSAPARPLLEIAGVSKSFGGVRALDGIDLTLERGAVLALVGENGAGKSTLLNIVSGLLGPDDGRVRFDGAPLPAARAHQALRRGIGTVHQELTLFPNLTVWENIFAGHERSGRLTRRLRPRDMAAEARTLLDRLGASAAPADRVEHLPLAEQHLVEVAKALSWRPRLLILDEATSALDQHQVERLFTVVRELAGDGAGIVFVSHRMPEVFAIADRALVLKDGAVAAAYDDLGDVTETRLVEAMVGRELPAVFPAGPERDEPGDALVAVAGLAGGDVAGVSLEVRSGEIVGLGGLQGHGQQDVLRLLYGVVPARGGTMEVGGRRHRPANVRDAAAAGVAYVPADRKTEGLLLQHSVEFNLTLPALRPPVTGPGGVLRPGAERRLADRLRAAMRVKQRQWRMPVSSLSGGNQQKVVLGRWMSGEVRLFLLDEPTRGVDVGTKSEIYRLLRGLADAGQAVLIASTDGLELLGLCDRVYVMYEGRVRRELSGASLTEYELTEATVGADGAEEVRR